MTAEVDVAFHPQTDVIDRVCYRYPTRSNRRHGNYDHISWPHISRWLPTHPHAPGSSGGDDVALTKTVPATAERNAFREVIDGVSVQFG
jgi:hypothetical protein